MYVVHLGYARKVYGVYQGNPGRTAWVLGHREGGHRALEEEAGPHHGLAVSGGRGFGLWLVPLGYLVYRSGYFPQALGVLLTIGAVGYLVDLFAHFLAPGVAESIEAVVVAPAAVAELWFVAYLLARGVRAPEPKALVPVAA